jgi:hypothetical protein
LGQFWYYDVSAALDAGDIAKARAVITAKSAEGAFDPNDMMDHMFRLAVAAADKNEAWLEEAEACLARTAGTWTPGGVSDEVAVVSHHLAGVARLPDVVRARAHFAAALRIAPDFAPTLVEVAILDSGRSRDGVFNSLGVTLPRTAWRYRLAASEMGLPSAPAGSGAKSTAICIRGLATPATPAVVRLMGALNPGVKIIVATWDHTPAAILEEIARSCELITESEPPKAGSQNKNRQIKLAIASLSAAARAGYNYVLLTRTDLALFRPGLAAALAELHRRFPIPANYLTGRLIVPDIFTRKYMPYRPSDLMTFGYLEDVWRYWNVPFDLTDAEIETEQYLCDRTAKEILRRSGLEMRMVDAYRNYRSLLRDYFIVRDFSWYEGVWLKYPHMRDGKLERVVFDCVSQADWERLHGAEDLGYVDAMGKLPNGALVDAVMGIAKW